MGLNKEIYELINQRRRQILVHSIIYYKLNESIISDSQWSKWAMELVDLQNKYSDISAKCVYSESFSNFNGSSGFDLPLDDEWGNYKAQQLLAMKGLYNDIR